MAYNQVHVPLQIGVVFNDPKRSLLHRFVHVPLQIGVVLDLIKTIVLSTFSDVFIVQKSAHNEEG